MEVPFESADDVAVLGGVFEVGAFEFVDAGFEHGLDLFR